MCVSSSHYIPYIPSINIRKLCTEKRTSTFHIKYKKTLHLAPTNSFSPSLIIITCLFTLIITKLYYYDHKSLIHLNTSWPTARPVNGKKCRASSQNYNGLSTWNTCFFHGTGHYNTKVN